MPASSPFTLPVLLFVMGLFWALILGVAAYIHFVAKTTRHTLLEYQRGVLFHRGKAIREVGPGTLKLRLGIDHLLFFDMRPKTLNFEPLHVVTRDGVIARLVMKGR